MKTTLFESKGPCTLYVSAMFGYRAIVCRSVKVERGPYAQHPAAYFITYVEKGKRSPRGVVLERSSPGLVADGVSFAPLRSAMDDLGGGASRTNVPADKVLFDFSAAPALAVAS
jgi:hypothetical protein